MRDILHVTTLQIMCVMKEEEDGAALYTFDCGDTATADHLISSVAENIDEEEQVTPANLDILCLC